MKIYFHLNLDGFSYAYRYPGMNKVLQAAGRVIRSFHDIGIIVFLDERFKTPFYQSLMPLSYQRHYQVRRAYEILPLVNQFFEKHKYPGIAFIFFFLQSSRYVSNEQPCLKTTGLYDDLLLLSSLFHFFYFIFSAPISSSAEVQPQQSPGISSGWTTSANEER